MTDFYRVLLRSELLKKPGLGYQNARFISDRQEEETLPTIIQKVEAENSVVLFGDKVSFAMWGSLARTWVPIGQQPTVKAISKNEYTLTGTGFLFIFKA